MTALTFNSVAEVLEREFHIERDRIRPDSRVGDLLDPPSVRDFMLAVEDAFCLRLPAGREATDAATKLAQLCDALEGSSDDFVPRRPPDRRSALTFQ